MADTLTVPEIKALEQNDSYAKFVVEPLERGYGVTLGNSLRRVLLSSIPGAAVTSVKIDGVLHEFSTIPGIKEDTTELLLNIKNLSFKVHDLAAFTGQGEPRTAHIDVRGEGTVTGGDVQCPPDLDVVNPDLYLASVSDGNARLSMELTIDIGRGYVLPDKHDKTRQVIGVIPIGAAFTPVRKVSYTVEATRVGFKTDFDRLVLEIWTNGTISPADALAQAAHTLEGYFHRFVEAPLGSLIPFGGLDGGGHAAGIGSGAPDARIEELDFSVRTYNCLKKANVLTIGELALLSEGDLMQIRNFGKKSLTEVKEKLSGLGMSLKGSTDGETFDDSDDDETDDDSAENGVDEEA
ncbi:MAG: DNA-directed RNA polymerase subunit alpha [Capsulimonadaceae bacterium]|nr:DNA-directed RNA polymerase subunit alpha [Capsulimonadaceae bacterium]